MAVKKNKNFKKNINSVPAPVLLKTPRTCAKCNVKITKIADLKTVVGYFNVTDANGVTTSKSGKQTRCRSC